ncbi:ras association domain-containing protein 10 [Molossus molossus]|uniref:Ras association domain family member 10 n=1 Tax=Molossus molossus TaxID=27622 RepID=A0A7J8EU21_MOLMO|nr:ras association domain-containing protein 10 [Molossus molossus]KAF6438831.1 Ras association domain family member 10 [Molossus molossus]
MDPSEKKISVWICQEEKLVSGLSRRTTCSDVVRVLLEDGCRRRRKLRQGRRRGSASDPPGPGELPEPLDDDDEDDDETLPPGLLCGPPQCYCIVEKWRGFERILPNKTRILRLWAAWGDEQENVRFVLVRSEASLPNTGPRSAEARVVLSRERPCSARGTPVRPSLAMTQEKQRRVVRKAFRKLAKLNRRRQQQPSSPCSSTSSSTASSCSSSPRATESASVERMETLVHLVLSQDHTIRQQVQRLRELDREIDRYEAKVHLDRMRRHGVNYVQDTYLLGAGIEIDGSNPGEEPEAAATVAAAPLDGDAQAEALEELARRCDDLLRLQEQRVQQEELLEHLSAEIQEELNQRWMRRRQEELAAREGSPEPEGSLDSELLLEQERVRTQLSTSLYIGLRLNTDLEAIKSDLDYSQQQWDSKERELQGLLQTLHTLELTVAPDGTTSSGGPSREPRPQARAEVWVDQARGLAKSCPGNDEDSDTGLSSMHSQDSDSVPVCESLV